MVRSSTHEGGYVLVVQNVAEVGGCFRTFHIVLYQSIRTGTSSRRIHITEVFNFDTGKFGETGSL